MKPLNEEELRSIAAELKTAPIPGFYWQRLMHKAAKGIQQLLEEQDTASYTVTRWWRLLDSKGGLKAETSNPQEIARFWEEGDTVERLFQNERTQWREVNLFETYNREMIQKIKEAYDDD